MNHQLKAIEQVEGAFVYKRKPYEDDRGIFSELYSERDVPQLPKFVGLNQSFSFGGVLRGMHSQKNDPQGKLVTCLYGEILDVIVDGRQDSPTFGKGYSQILNFRSLEGLYVPPGCFHGFLTLSKFAVVLYSTTTYHDSQSDGGVNWSSPEIRQLFPSDISPILSAKDMSLPTWQEYFEESV